MIKFNLKLLQFCCFYVVRVQVKLGLLPGAGGTQRLPKLVSITEALGMMLTGKTLSAIKAKKIGLIDRVVQPIGAGVKPAEDNNYDYLEQMSIFEILYFLFGKYCYIIFSISETQSS